MLFVYIFATLIIALFIITALMPKVYHVEKNIVIKKPVSEIMDRIGNLGDYALWNPWQQSDPSAKKTITGSPNTPGHKYAWDGKKVGIGSLTLNNLDEKHIHFDLEFLKPWKAKAKDNWLFETLSDGETKVTWQNNGELPWPIARLMGPMINKNLTHQFGIGLENLKKLCES